MKTPKFFELIGSFKGESSDPHFRVFVELADKDKDFWESQALGTAEGRAQMTALRTGLMEVLPSEPSFRRRPSQLSSRVTPRLSSQKRSPSLQKTGAERGSLETDAEISFCAIGSAGGSEDGCS
jgi:hypothetical protein